MEIESGQVTVMDYMAMVKAEALRHVPDLDWDAIMKSDPERWGEFFTQRFDLNVTPAGAAESFLAVAQRW